MITIDLHSFVSRTRPCIACATGRHYDKSATYSVDALLRYVGLSALSARADAFPLHELVRALNDQHEEGNVDAHTHLGWALDRLVDVAYTDARMSIFIGHLAADVVPAYYCPGFTPLRRLSAYAFRIQAHAWNYIGMEACRHQWSFHIGPAGTSEPVNGE